MLEISDSKRGWLAGIIDGEGSISIAKNNKTLTTKIGIEMTSEATIQEIGNILDSINVHYNPYYRERKERNAKPQFSLKVERMADCQKLANLLQPLSVTKKEHWKLVKEFTTSRLSNAKLQKSGKVSVVGSTFENSDYEWELFNQIKILNKRGIK